MWCNLYTKQKKKERRTKSAFNYFKYLPFKKALYAIITEIL